MFSSWQKNEKDNRIKKIFVSFEDRVLMDFKVLSKHPKDSLQR